MSCRSRIFARTGGQSVGQGGFTLTEMLIVIVVIGVASTMMFTFYKSSLFSYLDLQKTASNFTTLASQSQRIGKVVRGATDLIDPEDNSLEMYAYFYPTDTYVSKVKYYLDGTGTILYADVTPMSANPPVGSEVTASKKTYTIIDSFRQSSGVKLFQYLNSAGTVLSPPITDLHTVKTIRVNLAAATANNGNQVMTLEITLRNKKTNL